MNLRQKVPAAFALILCLTLGAGCGGLWFMGRALDAFQVDVLQRVADERAAVSIEMHFKAQVQEWKNTLLRGSDATLLAKHWEAFAREEKAVSDRADALLKRPLDAATEDLLRRFIHAHKTMAQAYRTGFDKFQAAGLDPSVGDNAVRGIDREPSKLLEALGTQMAVASAAIAQSAYTQGQQAKHMGLGWMALAAVLGLVLGHALGRVIVRQVLRATQVAADVARGNLDCAIDVQGHDELADLLRALAGMQERLRVLVGRVRSNAESVSTASAQIAQGNQDLSERTEQQAGALQQTSTTVDGLGSAVRHNADNAVQANALALGAREVAARGGEVVGRVVHTMKGINDSSKKIADIITVIDSIAFQTNILALNAAVEAARAGEQGRGFAVVASEVRTLAQRSAAAAKEIKTLISDSVERVEQGSALVEQAGQTMNEVVSAIKRVSDIVSDISTAGTTQSSGVAQVGQAVDQMEHATQQNAALVEQSAVAAASLRQQAHGLVQAVAAFRIGPVA